MLLHLVIWCLDFEVVNPDIEHNDNCKDLKVCKLYSCSSSSTSSSFASRIIILNCLFLHLCSLVNGSSHLKHSPFSLFKNQKIVLRSNALNDFCPVKINLSKKIKKI